MLQQDVAWSLMEPEILYALESEAFDLHYQPICDVETLAIVAYESLARWNHPIHGVISPEQFIPTAECSGLIHDLGFWILRRACIDLNALDVRHVNVNISPVQLQCAAFAARFARIIRSEAIEPTSITVEITEGVALHNNGIERRNLEMIRDLGCYLAIDDFGTGYASYDYVEKFPFNVLKIDKSLIKNIGRSKADAEIIEAIYEFGRLREMVIVAEGLETLQQLDMLRRLGCARVQGYLLGRPAAIINREAKIYTSLVA